MVDKDYHLSEEVQHLVAKTDTADGSGFEHESELPESNFQSFAEDDVENEEGEE